MRKKPLRQLLVAGGSVPFVLIFSFVLLIGAPESQAQTDWQRLERGLPTSVVVDPDSPGYGYRFEIEGLLVKVPEEFLTGGDAAVKALKRGRDAGRIDSLVALVLLTQLKDRPSAEALIDILNTRDKFKDLSRNFVAAIPLVLRYHLPANEWPTILTGALLNSPSPADSSIIACLTRHNLPEARRAYWHALKHVDSTSQQRIIDRLTHQIPDHDRILWDAFARSRHPGIQNMILDRLEKRNSPLWPAKADSLALEARGDAAIRVLDHASQDGPEVYRPLLRAIVRTAKNKERVIQAALQLSAEGDQDAIPALKHRFYESDPDYRVVTALALCRLGDNWGVGACVRLGLKHEKYRDEVIKALEHVSGLAFGNDDEKWHKWLETLKPY